MTTSAPRTVRLRRLGKLIERLRKRAGLTQAEAAELIGVNRSTWIAMEGGKSSPHRSNVLSVIAKFEASEEEAEELLALAVKPRDPAWMRPLRGRIPDPYGEYIDLESGALSIRAWEPLLIPGLLQTEDYARAHARGGVPQSTPEQVEARVTARMRRQAAFAERGAPLWVVIGEAALRYNVGGRDVQCEQLARLLEAGDEPNTTVQVIAFGGDAHPNMMGSFAILSFGEGDPPVVYVETSGGDLFLEEPADLTTFRENYAHLQAAALSPADTRHLITNTIDDLERRAVQNGPRIAVAQK
ncbi:helix-turn-helix domain-containing protein [Streptomyces lunaelactis]|uniref:helix-turn-helix domain-containing protein n=1 Tax=Streptomyces lunaelactis TaxID=1535768 RepID=UPI0015850A3B|nr:helix-turn-helix transcriptional regulator [Streptomyces lunaelactis]NUK86722.1 helix-turn-helix transcriptional regulator [Streptomyces lunaelactis]